jgi:mono/diheme cytochrome c family protein
VRLLPCLGTLCIFLALSQDAVAQTSAKPAPRTTKSGVYSAEQADRGQLVYSGMCKNCHTPESHTASTFTSKWNGKPLLDLYYYITEQMPKNAPGTLSEEEYADVLAYVLKLNRMPAGSNELSYNPENLKTIRIETTIPVRKAP